MAPTTCSAAAAAAGETLPGKAPKARNWLLLEHGGPWPVRAEAAARPELLDRLSSLPAARLALIRRHRGARGPGRNLQVRDTLAPGGASDPMLLVCVHAVRDGCCGRSGRPVAAALAQRYPDLTWETTHVGGHRLAANLVCLPHGYVFSRLTPETAVAAAKLYLEGRLLLESCRGRSGLAPAAQAAEMFVRLRLGVDAAAGVTVEALGSDRYEVRLPDGTADRVRVRESVLSTLELTSCSGERGPLVNYEEIGLGT